jgi:hypothetical protein
VPLSLIVAVIAGIRRERRVRRHLLRNEMAEGGQLCALSDQMKERVFKSVDSLDALARLDEMTWWHRRVFHLRRRSSLRERILCSCEPGDAHTCASSPDMLCEGKHAHRQLLKCSKIPFPLQERLDKADLSDYDRDIARSWIRHESTLDSLRDNWNLLGHASPLTEQGNRALRESFVQQDEDEDDEDVLQWLQQDKNGCCPCCHRAPKQAAGATGKDAPLLEHSPRLMATIAAEAGDSTVTERRLELELELEAEQEQEPEPEAEQEPEAEAEQEPQPAGTSAPGFTVPRE